MVRLPSVRSRQADRDLPQDAKRNFFQDGAKQENRPYFTVKSTSASLPGSERLERSACNSLRRSTHTLADREQPRMRRARPNRKAKRKLGGQAGNGFPTRPSLDDCRSRETEATVRTKESGRSQGHAQRRHCPTIQRKLCAKIKQGIETLYIANGRPDPLNAQRCLPSVIRFHPCPAHQKTDPGACNRVAL